MNMRTWKSIEMGGRDHALRTVVCESDASAVKVASEPPWKRGILRASEGERVRRAGQDGVRDRGRGRESAGRTPRREREDALPHDDVLARDVLCLADADLALDARRVERRRDLDDDVGRAQLGLEHGLDVHRVLDARLADLLNDGLHPEREVDVGRRAVPATPIKSLQRQYTRREGRARDAERESRPTHRMSSNSPSGGMNEMVRSESNLPSLTHWWNWQSSSSTELVSRPPRGALARAESPLQEEDRAGSAGCVRGRPPRGRDRERESRDARLVDDELVVEAELALGRPAEVGAHQDLPVDVGSKDRPCVHALVRQPLPSCA